MHLKALRAALAQAESHSSLGQAAREHSTPEQSAPVSEHGLDLLSLAIAGFEKLAVQDREPALAQIAVLGPTQAGKSTLVNLLVGEQVTTVSALAGHTRHARGAAVGVPEEVLEQIARALHPARRVAGDVLDADDLDQYSLVNVAHTMVGPKALSVASSRPTIVWDTPDFDSLAADSYRRAVLAIAGLADLIVLIVSRDKYGDMTVWELLDRLVLLGRRGLFVVNKVDPASWPELRDHLAATQEERLGSAAFEIACIDHVAGGLVPGGADAQAIELLAKLDGLAPAATAEVQQGIANLIDRGWNEWLRPLHAESAATAQYAQWLEEASAEFMQAYRRDYLADAERYDTFQRLLGELLVLLEIPMLARTMGSVRRVVTWPVRQLFGKPDANNSLGREPELLVEGAEHFLLGLRMRSLEAQPAHPFLTAVARRLQADQPQHIENFRTAAVTHHDEFQASVAAAAQTLYRNLQETPALLNSLRAMRAGADAAGVVVALQTGGIGLADLVLTPVMLSLTTTLTESAAKTYVDQVVGDLQEQQYAAVDALLQRELGATLGRYAEDAALLKFSGLDGVQLEAARRDFLQQVETKSAEVQA